MEDWHVDFINKYFAEHHGLKVKCTVAEAKGRILVANHTFRQGEVIFQEAPLHIVLAAEGTEAYRCIQRLCQKDPQNFYLEPLWYWAAMSSLTKNDWGDSPRSGLKEVDAATQKKILCLYHEPIKKVSAAADALTNTFKLAADPKKVDELLRCWILNCFDHSEKPRGLASYFASSFMSHSCHPNAIWSFSEEAASKDEFVLRARRDIAAGDEICISYLPEHGLLEAAVSRRRELQSSKSFLCTCERCGPGAETADLCRGFRCQNCRGGVVFHPGPLKGDFLEHGACRDCGVPVGEEMAKEMLKAEADLQKCIKIFSKRAEEHRKLTAQCEEDTGERLAALVSKQEVRAQRMLRHLGDGVCGLIGPQHWLCDEVWNALGEWYDDIGREEDSCRMLRLRVAYQRAAYPSLHGQLAWTLEAYAERLLQYAGARGWARPDDVRKVGLTREESLRMVAEASRSLKEAREILRLMFGSSHSYFSNLDQKYATVAKYMETGEWPIRPKKRKRSAL